jgi:hypothetical protein
MYINALSRSPIWQNTETRFQSGFQKLVGKTGRTVQANEIEIQYVNTIGGPLLTYLLTGTDRLRKSFCHGSDLSN